jgi:hypothetical protein
VSYDFAIWEGDAPTQAAFEDLYERYIEADGQPPTTRIRAFCEALDAQFPGPQSEDSPWAAGGAVDNASGPLVYVAVSYSRADEVGAVASQLAAEHGLVFFDPQAAPVSAGTMTITTSQGEAALPESWPRFLSHVLRDVDDYVIVDSGPDHLFAQARNDDGTFTLEYRDGSPQRHYAVSGVDLGDVAEALSQWSENRRDFIQNHTWHRLTDWD